MDSGAWRATVHQAGKSRPRLSTHTHTHLPGGCGVGVGIGTAAQPPPSCLTSSKPLRPLNPGFLI